MKKKIVLLAFIFCGLIVAGCQKVEIEEETIDNLDIVTLVYDSYLQNGEIIEQGIEDTITIGLNDSFPIFDTELLGLKSGDEKEFITKNPSEGYGIFYNDGKVQEIASSIFSIGDKPSIGDKVVLGKLEGIVLDVYPTTTKIDFNDKQTRENVEFHVTIKDIQKNVDNIGE